MLAHHTFSDSHNRTGRVGQSVGTLRFIVAVYITMASSLSKNDTITIVVLCVALALIAAVLSLVLWRRMSVLRLHPGHPSNRPIDFGDGPIVIRVQPKQTHKRPLSIIDEAPEPRHRRYGR